MLLLLSAIYHHRLTEGYVEDDLEANLQRDQHAQFFTTVNQLIDELTPSAPNFQLWDANYKLVLPVCSPALHIVMVYA